MYPAVHAQNTPDKPAVIMGSGEVVTYRQLNDRSNQCAQLFASLGLVKDDAIALFMMNCPEYFHAAWGAQRSGLYYAPISTHLSDAEAAYIVENSEAQVVVVSYELRKVALSIRNANPERAIGDPGPLMHGIMSSFGTNAETVYLSPAPLYHAAPIRFCMAMHRAGATAVVMNHFDPEQALRLIEQHKVTFSQWVPTMFIRMLKLPAAVRAAYDVSSHRVVTHSAAPCPIEIKQQMIDWWGPILIEYCGATEGHGGTQISSSEWLSHRGSVGRPVYGNVNVYPQETENVLVLHPAVADVAVIGIPNEDLGEEVKAVVEPFDMAAAGPQLEHELIAWYRARLSHIKCPRSIDVEAKLPRSDAGKLFKRTIRDRYWQGRNRAII